MCIEKRMADTYRVSVIFLLLFTANVPGGVFPKGMLRDAKQNPELASAKMQFIAFCVHREACYCSQNCAFCRAVNSYVFFTNRP